MLGTLMEDIGRSTNTAVTEPQSKVHAMELTYSAARSLHQNTDMRMRRLMAPLWRSTTSMEVVRGIPFVPLSDADMGLQKSCLGESHNVEVMP